MPCDGRDFFRLANDLASALPEEAEGGSEALLRSIVSRAYYGALHSVDAVFHDDEKPHNTHNGSSHERIIYKAEIAGNRPGNGKGNAAIITKHIYRIKSLRVSADYQLDEDFTIDDVKRALKHSKEVIEHCDEYARKTAQS